MIDSQTIGKHRGWKQVPVYIENEKTPQIRNNHNAFDQRSQNYETYWKTESQNIWGNYKNHFTFNTEPDDDLEEHFENPHNTIIRQTNNKRIRLIDATEIQAGTLRLKSRKVPGVDNITNTYKKHHPNDLPTEQTF